MILKVLANLKQRVIMKWESDEFEGKPENVMVGKWLPQDGILNHKNVQLFVSHCGLGSAVESKYFGVPMLGIPIFGDQYKNAENIVKEGWGIRLDLKTLDEEKLSAAIDEMLNNPKYSETVKRASELYRDRPMNARDTAAYWVEYVIRHRGAKHLQYPGVHINLLQANSIDVIAFLFVVIYVGFKCTVFSLKFIFSKICKRTSKLKIN